VAAPPLWRIGVLAEALNRQNNTIRKWEADGVIAEPVFRTGATHNLRMYQKGEMDLIVKSHKLWWAEHHRTNSLAPRPALFRFGQIYWHFRQYLANDRKFGTVFTIPEGAALPKNVKFDPEEVLDDLLLKSGETCSIMDKIKEVSRLIRDNAAWRISGEVIQYRIEAMQDLFRTQSEDDIIVKLERIQNHAESASS